MNTARVLVLMGGPDAEREVSLMSGAEVTAALRASGRYTVMDRVIDRPGLDELLMLVQQTEAEVVVPMLHGRWGEGGALQELLENIGLPYVGSGPRAAALAMDKLATKAILSRMNIQTPRARELKASSGCDIPLPVVLKPVDDGSSVDLRICRTAEELSAARMRLHRKRGRLMAEAYISGREITVGIICGEALPIIEIVPSAAVEFYDYQAKYFREDTRYVVDPELPAGVGERAKRMALCAYNTLGCRDVSRVDLMVDDRGPWFLEINTMPGFTTHSLVPKAGREAGVEMPELCVRLVAAALSRADMQGARAAV